MRAIATVALAAALVAPSAAAQEERPSTEVFTFPVFEEITNPCNGETIVVRGEAHAVAHANVDDAGGAHTTFAIQATQLEATAPDGTPLDYRVIEREAQSAELPGPPFVDTTTQTFQLVIISDGGEPNAVAHATFHFTFVDGEPTAEVAILRIDCTGAPAP